MRISLNFLDVAVLRHTTVQLHPVSQKFCPFLPRRVEILRIDVGLVYSRLEGAGNCVSVRLQLFLE
jgi:hypothetical protein